MQNNPDLLIDNLSKAGSPPDGTVVLVSPSRIALILGSIIATLIALALAGQIGRWFFGLSDASGFLRWVDVEAEKNPPALFAGLQLLMAAALAWLASRCDPVGARRRGWLVLTAGMAWMAFDEVFWMHERLIGPVKALIGQSDLGPFTYAWVLPALVIVAGFALYFIGFLKRLPGATRIRLLLGGAIFVGGAIGLEMAGGWYWAAHGNDFVQSLLVIVEEAMEFAGIAVFISATLRFLEHEAGTIRWRLGDGR